MIVGDSWRILGGFLGDSWGILGGFFEGGSMSLSGMSSVRILWDFCVFSWFWPLSRCLKDGEMLWRDSLDSIQTAAIG